MQNTKRNNFVNLLEALYYPVIAVVVAILLSGLMMQALGFDPINAYMYLFQGAFGSVASFSENFVKGIPLVFMGLSFAMAMRSGIINLGATGQLYIGALFGTFVGTHFAGLPIFIHLPLTLIAGFLGGGLMGWIVSFLKSRFGASELITTIMLNNIAIQLISYMVTGPMKDNASSSFPQSARILESAELPILLDGTRLHAGLIIAILAIVFYYVFLWWTRRGYEVRVVGANKYAGVYAGMNVRKNQMIAMVIAGGMAGLGGCIEILSVQTRLMQAFAGNTGFDGVAVALLGNNSPIGIGISAFLFGMLNNGSSTMEMLARVPNAMIYMIQGLIILLVVGRNMFRFEGIRKKFRKKKHVKEA